jgi:PAS domain S-box-containing protein
MLMNDRTKKSQVPFDVIALVASAGGYQAILDVLQSLPADFSIPILVMMHLSSDDGDVLNDAGRNLPLVVEWIRPDSILTPGRVLVCPPQSYVEVLPEGTFVISPNEHGASGKPMDRLFESLAQSFGTRAIGVILSGMESDAALGALRLHMAGGKVLVQSEETSEYPNMPRAAVQAGAADLVVPLQEMGQRIYEIAVRISQPHSEPEPIHQDVVSHVTLKNTALGDDLAKHTDDRYQALFNSIDEGFCLIDVLRDNQGVIEDLYFREANAAFIRQTGLSEVVGRSVFKLLPNFEQYWVYMIGQVLRTGQPVRTENYLQDAGRWYSMYLSRIGEENGSQVFVVLNDITRHKQAEAQLHQAADLNAFRVKLNDALNPLGEPHHILKEAMRVIGEELRVDRVMYAEVDEEKGSYLVPENYVRGETPRIVGSFALSDFEIASDILRQGQILVLNDVRNAPDLTKTERENLLSAGITAALGIPLIKDDRWVASFGVQHSTPREWTISETELVQEAAESTWAAVERARAGEALRQSENRYRMLYESLRDAFVQVDMAGNIISFNEIYCQMLGYSQEELARLTYRDLTPERWHAFEEEIVREQVLARGFSNIYEKEYRRKDGTVFPVELRTILWRDPAGRPQAMWALIRDITDRKRTEAALRENEKQLQFLNESLEQKVEEKTSELRQLASELTRAEQRERNRISHILHDDLQQRIYAIQMQLSFLRQELRAENEAAQREAVNIDRELDDVLKISRNLSIDLSPPILRGEGLTQAISWLASKMGQQYGMPINILADESFTISDDELHVLLFNCVRELLFNVVKHAEASHADVSLQWSGSILCIEVSDDGTGFLVSVPGAEDREIGEEDLQPSYGHSTIRHQLSLYGGRMEIHSRTSAGTRIVLSVPAAKA